MTVGVPASLKTALPNVVGKAPGDRGSFDLIVLEQFEADIVRRLSELQQTLEDGAPAAAEREAAVAAAEATLLASKERQRTAAHVQKEAESGEDGTAASMAVVKAEQSNMRSFMREMAAAERNLAQQQDELELFRGGVLVPFRALRDSPVEPLAPQAAARGEGAAEAPSVLEAQAEEAGVEHAAAAAA
jgi:hypothetical protein